MCFHFRFFPFDIYIIRALLKFGRGNNPNHALSSRNTCDVLPFIRQKACDGPFYNARRLFQPVLGVRLSGCAGMPDKKKKRHHTPKNVKMQKQKNRISENDLIMLIFVFYLILVSPLPGSPKYVYTSGVSKTLCSFRLPWDAYSVVRRIFMAFDGDAATFWQLIFEK